MYFPVSNLLRAAMVSDQNNPLLQHVFARVRPPTGLAAAAGRKEGLIKVGESIGAAC